MLKTIDDLPTLEATGDLWVDAPSIIAQAAQRHGPIFKREFAQPLNSGLSRIVFMVGPEANRFILHTHRDHFSHAQGWTPILGPFFGKGLLNMDGEEWQQHRRMMNPAFTQAYMSRYLPIMQRVIEQRTSDWAERGEVDLYEESREIAFDVAAGALAGLHDTARRDALRRLFYALLHADYDDLHETLDDFRGRMMSVEEALHSLLLPLIQERREAGAAGGEGDDVLQLLVQARDEHGQALSDAQLLAHLNILLVAGHETTTTLAAWLLYLLATHPDYLARIHSELHEIVPHADEAASLEQLRQMTVLQAAITEAGRLHSPVRFGPRGVVKTFDFGGYTIPAGTHVRYSIAAGHRLPEHFANPDTFDPDRFAPPREEDKKTPYALITFGGGPRTCIGVNMAQVEVKALAAHVLRRYTITPVTGTQPVQVGLITGFPENGVRVRVCPRSAMPGSA